MTITDCIKSELIALGIYPHYHGHRQSLLAIELALEDENRLLDMTKQIYWVVAKACSCDRPCVERNIRTAIRIAWDTNPSRLCELAGRQFNAPPTVSDFISILTAYIQRTYLSLSQ